MADECNCCQEWYHPGRYCFFWKPFGGGELHSHLYIPGIPLNLFALEKGGTPGSMDYFAVSYVVDISDIVKCRFCLLASMEQLLAFKKSILLKKVIAINIIVITNHKVGFNQL